MIEINQQLNSFQLDRLKLEALLQTSDLQMPRAAAKKLQKIMMDDQIQPEEFAKEFEGILKSTQTFSWKVYLYVSNIKSRFFEELTQVSWLQAFGFIVSLSFLYFLYKKFKLEKEAKQLSKIGYNLLERMVASFGYFFPLLFMYQMYLMPLFRDFPGLLIFYSSFMQKALKIYNGHPNIISYTYFFLTIYLCTGIRLPRSRFVRFHMIRGVFLFSFQNLPESLYNLFYKASIVTNAQQKSAIFFLLVFNAFLVLPGVYQALTHSYPKSYFIREATEDALGRDRNEGFKWWNKK